MSVGIIDHETGTRDMRRLDGHVPLHADHRHAGHRGLRLAMAGVPLLNGFLSKEMFFARPCLHQRSIRASSYGLPAAATLAGHVRGGVFAALRPRRVLRRPADRPARASTARARATGCGCRWNCWCWPAWWSACCRPGPSGSLLATAAASRWSAARCPEYSLAVWHGFNAPLLMSLIATVGGLLVYVCAKREPFSGAAGRAAGGATGRQAAVRATVLACRLAFAARR